MGHAGRAQEWSALRVLRCLPLTRHTVRRGRFKDKAAQYAEHVILVAEAEDDSSSSRASSTGANSSPRAKESANVDESGAGVASPPPSAASLRT